jgi:hypothetical protein
MNSQSICFVNAASTKERIQVTDSESAEALKRLLSRLAQVENEKWILEEEAELAQAQMQEQMQDMFELQAAVQTVLPSQVQTPDQANAKTFRVILISGTSTFRSGLKEITVEGMKLKNTVPASFNAKECIAYISHDKMRENVEISCAVTTDFDGTSWLEFVAPKASDLEKLSEWMSEPAL